MQMPRFRCALAALSLAGLPLAAPGCRTNPATGETFFAPTSSNQIAAMGAQAAPQLAEQFGGPVPDQALQEYITRVGRSMTQHTEADFPGIEWEFTLLNSPIINAFALPGGKVFITRGLVERMNNEAQLAGVLGHEIGHVTAEHIARRIGQQTLLQGALAVTGLAVSSGGEGLAAAGQYLMPAMEVGGKLTLLKFGREEENQADDLGMRYMSRAGYNPHAQLTVMQILAESAGEGGRPPEFLSTHPMPETRVQRIENLLRTTYANTQNNPQYQLHAERFQQQFLSRLRALPPAPEPRAAERSAQRAAQPRQQLRAVPERRPMGNQVISRPAR